MMWYPGEECVKLGEELGPWMQYVEGKGLVLKEDAPPEIVEKRKRFVKLATPPGLFGVIASR